MDQKVLYSGYKKVHSIKFQAIMAPDGLIIHLAGTFIFYFDYSLYLYFVLFILCKICTRKMLIKVIYVRSI